MSDTTATTPPTVSAAPRQFPCVGCGAKLFWDPGTRTLKCPYCATENVVEPSAEAEPVRELDFYGHLKESLENADTVETLTVRCSGCGAEQALRPGQTAGTCVFCGSPMVAESQVKRVIKPRAVLPFAVSNDVAGASFQQWIKGRWFAPNDLKRLARRDGLKGVYVPAWTFDAQADTRYTGDRGDDYWDTEWYTTTVNGKTERRSRQVRRTRWTWVSGRVHNTFDDVLVLAVRTLPPKAQALEPWDLPALVPYDDRYLSGFVSEVYTIDLANGFELGKQFMAGVINTTICRDIGGDHQRVSSADTNYYDIKFKHILLPIWISAYRYHDRVYTFLVNARTGEVQGDRPYSVWKILLTVLLGLAIVAAIFLVARR